MKEIKIKENSGRYDFKGNLEFLDENNEVLKMNELDALEIAYTLFNSYNMPYTVLDELNERIDD